MSDEKPRKPGKIVTYGSVVLAVGLVLLLFQRLDLHGTRLPPTAVGRGAERQTDNPVADLQETLRREPGLVGCRNLIAQLNRRQTPPPAWTTKSFESVRKEFHLDDGEFAEVTGTVYTPLDAYYLDQCFLLHAAARSLDVDGLPARDRAAAGFAWTMRQVCLRESNEPASPPAFVLRRGWGTDRERALVFLALLDQLGIPGCTIVVRDGENYRDWLAGALADGQIYLFDARLGLPLPGPSGTDIATLAQVKTQPDLLKPLSTGDLAYDVAFAQSRQAEPRIACPLSALAPRMRPLEGLLEATDRPHLVADPVAVLKQFRDALDQTGLADCPVRVCDSAPKRDDAPRVLRSFLRPEEGGTDRPTEGVWRQAGFNQSLTPWQLLPAPVQQLPESSDLGLQLRLVFAKPFLDMAYDPRMPRELLLRGRLDEAVARLVEIRGTFGRLRESGRDEPNPNQVLEQWVREARRVYAELSRVQREAGGKETEALRTAQENRKQLWEAKQARKPIDILRAAAAEPCLAQATFFLALTKHELAERTMLSSERTAEGKAAWQTAADWWRKYLDDYPARPEAADARLHLARALAAQGKRDAALQLLQHPRLISMRGKNAPARFERINYENRNNRRAGI